MLSGADRRYGFRLGRYRTNFTMRPSKRADPQTRFVKTQIKCDGATRSQRNNGEAEGPFASKSCRVALTDAMLLFCQAQVVPKCVQNGGQCEHVSPVVNQTFNEGRGSRGVPDVMAEVNCKIADQHPGLSRLSWIRGFDHPNKHSPEAARGTRGLWSKSIFFQRLIEQIKIAVEAVYEILQRFHPGIQGLALDAEPVLFELISRSGH